MMRSSTNKPQSKRQSRLAFTPAPASSSPGAERSPGTGSDRVASVRYWNPDSSPLSKRGALTSQPTHSSPSKNISDEKLSSTDEESVRGSSSARRTAKRPVVEVPNDDEDESDEIVTSPMKRRKKNALPAVRTPSPPEHRTGGEESDIAADVADLQGSDTAVTETRTRGRAAVSATKKKRTEQLEALRRRRAGDKGRKASSASQSPEPSETSGSESSEESGDEDPLLADKDSDVESAMPEDLDEYEDDFVLQDDNAELGAPAELQEELPFEFSRHRYKRLRDHFKDVIEWMVHNKLNPAFSRNDQVYRIAFAKVKDEVTGVAGSQLVSSVWNDDFKRSLEARPGIKISGYPVSEGHPCDACNRSKHPASYDIRFDGKPYLLETLEPLSDDDSEETSDDDNRNEEAEDGNVDREGYEIPGSSKHFYLGRHCKSKAAMAHTLVHWRYHLNEWVVDHLQRQGVFADARILERERWSQKRRTKYANETVDAMEGDGEIDRLFKDFNLNVKTAKGAKESRW